MTAISIKNLTKYYGKQLSLDNLNLEIKEGEFFGFLGPNGAGKTTTINAITGLSTFQKGQITVLGKDVVKDYLEARKLVGLSLQEFNFDPFFSVEKILAYQGGFFGLRGNVLKNRITELLKQFDLESKRKVDTNKISGGMKRRLMIAKALIHYPKVLILDEPTEGVDVELRHELWEFLKKINRSGVTIFLTTHYIEEVEKLCDRVAILSKGKLVALDTVANLKAKYSNDYIEIETDKGLKTLPQGLRGMQAELDGHTIRIQCANCVASIGGILSIFEKEKIKLTKFLVSEDSLENIYLKLTKE